MPYNLFILPIITGYLILTSSLLFKYNIQRLSRTRILFESVGLGIIIVAFGFILRTILQISYKPSITQTLHVLKIFPFKKPEYFWTIMFSCLLGLILVWIINFRIRKKYQEHEPIIWAIKQNGDEIERLFKDSVEQGFAMQITLKNNKVYIGFSETIPIPEKTNYLTITPIISGYRDSETKKINITTDYFKIVSEFIADLASKNEEKSKIRNLNTDIIIKQDEILTASIYDQKIHDKFNESQERKPIKAIP